MMRIAIRADASVDIGSGHVMRCLALAEKLRKCKTEVIFICRELEGSLCDLIAAQRFTVHWLSDTAPYKMDWRQDAEQSIAACSKSWPKMDWVIVDHYHLDAKWETFVRSVASKVMVIDDLANRDHDCDALLDQNYFPDGEQRYATLVPPSCRVLLGPSYALLRQEFRSIREHLEPRSHELKSILVFFTAGDDKGETLKAMQGIEFFGKAECVDVVVGQSNPGNAEIVRKCNELHWRYHCQVDYMPRLIAQADLVIGAGGSSNWERCALGIPSLVTILAENQAPIAQALSQAGIVFNLGWSSNLQAQDYADALITLNHDCLTTMSKKALALVDAKGAERVAGILLAAQPKAFEQPKQKSC